MDEIPSDLPSKVDETRSACPRFRIVLIGNVSGVGKSSLVQSVFKIDLKNIDIAHDRPGNAEIDYEYTSKDNPFFVLHDSKGFEAGSETNWKLVEEFLRERNAKEPRDQVHAIWLCLAAPRDGSRLQQTGDENLLLLANELNIPVIVVFTKYDLLVNEQKRKDQNKPKQEQLSQAQLEEKAEACFDDRIKILKTPMEVSMVKVSTSETYPRRLKTLDELIKATLRCLDPESVSLTWVIAQRISASQKVESSIKEGFKKYWRNLAKSPSFQGQKMNKCVWRIHDDIIKVWNFNDPHNVLRGKEFLTKMVLLVKPLFDGSETDIQQDDWLSKGMSAAHAATLIAIPFAHVLAAAGISVLALKFLYGKYKEIALSARYLGAYIVHLICILQRLLDKTQDIYPPRALSKKLVLEVMEEYDESYSVEVCMRIEEMTVDHQFEIGIADLIRQHTIPLGFDERGLGAEKKAKHRPCIVM